VAESWARQVLSLPLYPDMTEEEQTRVIEAVAHAYRQFREE
jgi:dTDP-4-amino-4,6-dideoxygalactose transaminase